MRAVAPLPVTPSPWHNARPRRARNATGSLEEEAYSPETNIYLDSSTGDYVIPTDSVALGNPHSFYVHNITTAAGSWPGDVHVYGVKDGGCKLMAISSELTGFTSGDGGDRFLGYVSTVETDEVYQLKLNEDTFEFETVG